MTVILTGRDLTPADVLAVARLGERVEIGQEAVEAMTCLLYTSDAADE